MINTLKNIFKINSAQAVNRFIYFFKRIPLVGKILPDGIYSDSSLKYVFSAIILVLRYLFKFFSKALYLGVFIFLPLTLIYKDISNPELVNMGIHIFVCLSFVLGALQETPTFKIDANRFTCIKILHMKAKHYAYANIIFDNVLYFVTFLPSILILGAFFGLPLLKGLLLTSMLIVARLLGICIQHLIFSKTKKVVFNKWWWYLIIWTIPISAAYLPLLKSLSFNYTYGMLNIFGLIISIIIGILCVLSIKKYPLYYLAVNESLKEDTSTEKVKENASELQFAALKLKDEDLMDKKMRSTKINRLKGYDLLNAIFFERHRRLLIKPIIIRVLIVAGLFLIGTILTFVIPKNEVNEMILKLISSINVFVFIMYVISTGDRIAKAMFFNCDISLLRYSFYREKNVILKNFWIRVKKAILYNLIPALTICAAITGLILIAQVNIDLMVLIPFMASILILSVFFAVHHIFLYYVFQPYTTELDVKNPFFKIINSVIYLACFISLQVDSVPSNFVFVVLAATIIYIITALILVQKFAPKMFKVK